MPTPKIGSTSTGTPSSAPESAALTMAQLASFLKIFPMSRALPRLGVRVAIEFSQRTRCVFDISISTWLQLVGSSFQSFAKQIMSCPAIFSSLSWPCISLEEQSVLLSPLRISQLSIVRLLSIA